MQLTNNGSKTRFEFELILFESEFPSSLGADEFLDRVEEAMFEAFEGDVTPTMTAGVPTLYCTIVGTSIGDALDKVANKIIELGLHPAQLLMDTGEGKGRKILQA